MKKLILLLPFLVLLSCSVQKRKYQKGYYITRKHQSQNEKTKEEAKTRHTKPAAKTPEVRITPLEELQTLLATVQNEKALNLAKNDKKPSVFKKDEPCDDIVFKDGTEQKAKIIEINTTEIKYKKCDQTDGPLYVARKSEVFMIKYANGTREVFKNDAETAQAPVKNKPINPANLRTHPMAVLSVILGILGIYPLIGFASIAAIILANYAIRKIREQPDVYKGEGAAITGKVLGIIGLCLAIIYLLFIFVIIASVI